jgi:hypothetical protein
MFFCPYRFRGFHNFDTVAALFCFDCRRPARPEEVLFELADDGKLEARVEVNSLWTILRPHISEVNLGNVFKDSTHFFEKKEIFQLS